MDEIPEKSSTVAKKYSSSKEKVAKKLSKLRMRDKSIKNGDAEDQNNQVKFFLEFHDLNIFSNLSFETFNKVSLSESVEEAQLAVEMFLNNNFEEARNIVQPM